MLAAYGILVDSGTTYVLWYVLLVTRRPAHYGMCSTQVRYLQALECISARKL